MTLLVRQQERPRFSARQAAQGLPQLTTTVPREYVHRAAHAEVFLTGCRRLDGTRFEVTGQWPRAHTFFTDENQTRHDPMLAAETVRQVGLLLAHSEFGVPLGHQFLLHDMEYSVSLANLGIGTEPSELLLEAVCSDVKWRGNRLAQFGMTITVERDGRHAAMGRGHFTCVAPAAYRRLRAGQGDGRDAAPAPRPAPLAPWRVGRCRAADVVLSATDRPDRWLLAPDRGHPILFEHAGDHVPGMVLIEAARQAACGLLALPGFVPVEVAAEFHQYAEFGSPCWIEAVQLPSPQTGVLSVQVTGRQDGGEVFGARLNGVVA
ncbi:ScbA/BarX family gamma-butyrolactone biosynthesis protein [Streptomyces rubradiris]|uniref:Adhesin n=1 Tax=Streptomyces rubradiris TaxID=285531 RepID=A0ABQ3RQW7_STRRR|nr:ScbA/BarX family gamma-butyrolactone biosynthesis protein [Streptomyces rubradiris]GHH24718.1 adhesin [Streptomyces rubradiris]GHI58256.1 adhesin [Streptomyces rubradiris]